MFSCTQRQHVPAEQPRVLRSSGIHLHFTFSHFWRLLIVGLMTSLYTIGLWSGLLAQAHAYAASLTQPLPSMHAASPQRGNRLLTATSSVAACPKLTGMPTLSAA